MLSFLVRKYMSISAYLNSPFSGKQNSCLIVLWLFNWGSMGISISYIFTPFTCGVKLDQIPLLKFQLYSSIKLTLNSKVELTPTLLWRNEFLFAYSFNFSLFSLFCPFPNAAWGNVNWEWGMGLGLLPKRCYWKHLRTQRHCST